MSLASKHFRHFVRMKNGKQTRKERDVIKPIRCHWCDYEIEEHNAYLIKEDADGNNLYWCGECEEGENDPECVSAQTEDHPVD